ncbi:hypothetical protein BBBOND_0303060 [Babesia bigemina]|uniref:Uncharacterized protein n=1 Tax=Babesia bigemina TaxID=5866 RepID=A0A061D8V6_BABBI|nr:hypothetical protein BBBOND_0303060 [Babesia bigemina]CDR96402.1 hypothetical protein BBBOND_0303060 [Babesia bigemina]|eukprot:XP_012768588.1 hypothetical protein BBBOND_0303060 [Babesia bigemina]
MAPQFKRLTDCPENLREAIDWLIQVRHGGDGKGLDELAKAMKKLIEGAIVKSFSSFCDHLCTSLDSAGKRYECCRIKIEGIKALKSETNKAGNVEDNKLQRLLNEVKALKNGCETNHRVDSSTNKALNDVQSRIEYLEGLSKNLSEFTRDPNPILKQLCCGLETFLGFDPKTKGYDGTGIVYSDLDRLCDAVMAFLHRVLESVKEDESVKTYWSCVNEDVDTMKSQLQTGQKGLGGFLSAVESGVINWERVCHEKVGKVTDELKKLKSNLSKDLKFIKKENVELTSVEGHVNRCIQKAKASITALVDTPDSGIRALDPSLQNNLKEPSRHIRREIWRFGSSAVRNAMHLQELSDKVQNELETLEHNVKYEIKERVDEYKSTLTSVFSIINKDIDRIRDKLKEHVQALTTWIQAAELLVTQAIPQIDAILNAILDRDNKTHPQNIRTSAETLQRKADALRQAVENAKAVLEPLVGSISSAVKELEDVYKQTLKALQSTLKHQITEAQGKLNQLDGKVRDDLGGQVKEHIMAEITKVITQFKEGIMTAAQDEGTSTALFIQEFRNGLNHRGDAKALWQWADAWGKSRGVGHPLEKLQRVDTNFKELKEVLKDLENYKFNTKNFFGVIIDDLESKLMEAINTIKRNLLRSMPNYHGHANNNNGTIHMAIKGVQTNIDEYFQGDESGELTEEKLEQHGYKGGEKNKRELLTDEIQKIESQGLAKFEPFENGRRDAIEENTFSTLYGNITSNLTQLISAIKENGDNDQHGKEGIKQKLETLRDTFFNKKAMESNDSIYKISKDLDELQSRILGELIKKAADFLSNTIPNKAEKCVNDIHKHLSQASENARYRIIHEAEKQYKAARIFELEVLEKSVEKQFDEITRRLAADTTSGIKGFLKMIKGEKSGNKFEALKNSSTLDVLYIKIRDYLKSINNYVASEFDNPPYLRYIVSQLPLYLENLLDGLARHDYDHTVSTNLAELNKWVAHIHPKSLVEPSNLPAEALKNGLQAFGTELGKAYFNKYSGDTWDLRCWYNFGKIGLTILHTLHRDLSGLLDRCDNEWRDMNIDLRDNSALGNSLDNCGFKVSDAIEKQNGELNKDKKGENILTLLIQNDRLFERAALYKGVVIDLSYNLKLYYKAHQLRIIESYKAPTSVFEMLCWLSGLRHSRAYSGLRDQIKSLFSKPQKDETRNISKMNPSELTLSAYPESFSAADIQATIRDVCRNSHAVLTSILGHGHARGIYACDFSNNALNLHYPTDLITLLCLFHDILRCLHHQLYFLYKQCWYDTKMSGWANCWYGKGVSGSHWQCNELQCAECGNNTNCSEHPRCDIRSPLQSFLEDGLPGFLPHPLDGKSGKIKCTVSSHVSAPCITPMGFSDISVTASHRSTGAHLKSVVGDFCGDSTACLSKLCSQLNCLLPSAPKTLGEMFAFYYNFFYDWDASGEHRKDALGEAVKDAYFGSDYDLNSVSNLVNSTDHATIKSFSKQELGHEAGDLHSLDSFDKTCYTTDKYCGSYINALTSDTCRIFSKYNAPHYLSWVIYLTESFYNLICELYKQCHANCGTEYKKCLVTGCVDICGVNESNNHKATKHGSRCNSILNCRYTMQTLYNCGLTFGNRQHLKGRYGKFSTPKKTCRTFIAQLEVVCSDSSILSKLIHRTIPEFLWKIREPFSYLVLALWLLSFLYLLHIMVIRLDLLHIKSHLHSPSSHRIAAQSLLAAARVGKLAKLTYLQP